MQKTIEQIRLGNARALAQQAGSQSNFARRMGQSRQLANNYFGPHPVKTIGSTYARNIERAFGLPSGWMDHEHSPAPKERPDPTAELERIGFRLLVPRALAADVRQLVEDFLVASPAERRAISSRASRAAERSAPKEN